MHTSVSVPTRTALRAPVASIAAAIPGLSGTAKIFLGSTGAAGGSRAATFSTVGPLRAASSSVTTMGTASSRATAVTQGHPVDDSLAFRAIGVVVAGLKEAALDVDHEQHRVVSAQERHGGASLPRFRLIEHRAGASPAELEPEASA